LEEVRHERQLDESGVQAIVQQRLMGDRNPAA